MTTDRAFPPTCARKCSSRSSGWMAPATRTRAALASDLRSPATSRARMAAISCSATARWAACARRCGSRCEFFLAPLNMRRGLDGIAGIEIADDFRVRCHRYAGHGANRIGNETVRRLLDILLGANLLGHRRDRVAHVLVGGLVGTMLHRHVGQAC